MVSSYKGRIIEDLKHIPTSLFKITSLNEGGQNE